MGGGIRTTTVAIIGMMLTLAIFQSGKSKLELHYPEEKLIIG